MTSRAEMLRAIDEHVTDSARVTLSGDLRRLSADMSDSVDDGERMDAIEAARANWLEGEAIVAVLRDLYGRVCREDPERAREIVSGTLGGWIDEAGERHRKLRAARGEFAACSGCGVEAQHEDLREARGFARGLHCEACDEDAERVEGLGGF